MKEQSFFQLDYSLVIILTMLFSTLAGAIYLNHDTEGQVFSKFKLQPKQTLLNALIASLVFAGMSLIPTLLGLLVAGFINIDYFLRPLVEHVFLIVVVGTPLVYINYIYIGPFIYKIFNRNSG